MGRRLDLGEAELLVGLQVVRVGQDPGSRLAGCWYRPWWRWCGDAGFEQLQVAADGVAAAGVSLAADLPVERAGVVLAVDELFMQVGPELIKQGTAMDRRGPGVRRGLPRRRNGARSRRPDRDRG